MPRTKCTFHSCKGNSILAELASCNSVGKRTATTTSSSLDGTQGAPLTQTILHGMIGDSRWCDDCSHREDAATPCTCTWHQGARYPLSKPTVFVSSQGHRRKTGLQLPMLSTFLTAPA